MQFEANLFILVALILFVYKGKRQLKLGTGLQEQDYAPL
jgi:hypothetical protein